VENLRILILEPPECEVLKYPFFIPHFYNNKSVKKICYRLIGLFRPCVFLYFANSVRFLVEYTLTFHSDALYFDNPFNVNEIINFK
jgi:hypothetical protein